MGSSVSPLRMFMDSQLQASNSSPFASVGTAVKTAPDAINPRTTRYGILPIYEHPTNSRTFGLWVLPSNIVFPFRPFMGEVVKDLNDNVLASVERMPADQITDMHNTVPGFIELPALSKLSEERAGTVVTALMNPNKCSKYPFELKKECISCWLDYLRNDSSFTVATLSVSSSEWEPAMIEIAKQSADALVKGFEVALDEARRQLDVAVREVDDPKSGKDQFHDVDYLNIFHTHASRPTFRTSTAGADVGTQIAEALRGLQAPGIDAAAIGDLVKNAVAEQTAGLQAELDAYRAADAAAVDATQPPASIENDGSVPPQASTCQATTASGNPCKNEALADGFCKIDAHNAIREAELAAAAATEPTE